MDELAYSTASRSIDAPGAKFLFHNTPLRVILVATTLTFLSLELKSRVNSPCSFRGCTTGIIYLPCLLSREKIKGLYIYILFQMKDRRMEKIDRSEEDKDLFYGRV